MERRIKFVGLDVHKETIAVAVAEDGADREVRFQGTIASTAEAVRRLVARLAGLEIELRFCYEAGPFGLGLHRQLRKLGAECLVIAPSTMPRRPGERVKTINCNPRHIRYPFPGNDDASRAINLYCDLAVGAVLDGIQAEMSASGIDIGAISDLGEIKELPEGVEVPAAAEHSGAAGGARNSFATRPGPSDRARTRKVL